MSAKDIAEQDRQFARERGDQLYGQSMTRAQTENSARDAYRSQADQRNQLIENGYSPEEVEAILNQGGLDALQYSDSDAQANYLTDQERQAIAGDPQSRLRYYNPEYTSNLELQGEQAQRGAAQGLRRDLNAAINPQDLRMSEGYAGSLSDQLNATDTGVADTVNDTEHNVRGAIDRSKLAQDSEVAGRVRMTPEQQQDIVTGAGISAGTGYRAAEGALERQARAAGASPMGVQANRQRMEREAAGEAGDAMTKARIAANEAAANREMELEKNRQQTEQYIAGETAANEQQLGAARMGAQERSGQRRLNAVADVEDRRVAGARDLSDRQMQAATTAGTADINNERAIAGQAQDTERFNQELGTQIQTGVDQAQSDRAKDIAGNRQNVSQYNSQQRYQRGMDINTAESNRAGRVGDTRIGAGTSSRDYYGGVSTQRNQNAQNEFNRQNDIYGTQTGAMNRATGNYISADELQSKKPGVFGRIMGGIKGAAQGFAVGGPLGAVAGGAMGAATARGGVTSRDGGGAAKGGVFTEPTRVIIGENGPEAVVPLNNEDGNSEYYGVVDGGGMAKGGFADQPTMATIGENGPEAVVPLTPRQPSGGREAQIAASRRGSYGASTGQSQAPQPSAWSQGAPSEQDSFGAAQAQQPSGSAWETGQQTNAATDPRAAQLSTRLRTGQVASVGAQQQGSTDPRAARADAYRSRGGTVAEMGGGMASRGNSYGAAPNTATPAWGNAQPASYQRPMTPAYQPQQSWGNTTKPASADYYGEASAASTNQPIINKPNPSVGSQQPVYRAPWGQQTQRQNATRNQASRFYGARA